jgi:hypothetical protein
MGFSQNLAWTTWCAFNPIDCTDFIREHRAAMEAYDLGWIGPAERFVDKWEIMAQNNELLADAIGDTLAQVKTAVRTTIQQGVETIVEPLAQGLKPLYGVVVAGLIGLYLWKS